MLLLWPFVLNFLTFSVSVLFLLNFALKCKDIAEELHWQKPKSLFQTIGQSKDYKNWYVHCTDI